MSPDLKTLRGWCFSTSGVEGLKLAWRKRRLKAGLRLQPPGNRPNPSLSPTSVHGPLAHTLGHVWGPNSHGPPRRAPGSGQLGLPWARPPPWACVAQASGCVRPRLGASGSPGCFPGGNGAGWAARGRLAGCKAWREPHFLLWGPGENHRAPGQGRPPPGSRQDGWGPGGRRCRPLRQAGAEEVQQGPREGRRLGAQAEARVGRRVCGVLGVGDLGWTPRLTSGKASRGSHENRQIWEKAESLAQSRTGMGEDERQFPPSVSLGT